MTLIHARFDDCIVRQIQSYQYILYITGKKQNTIHVYCYVYYWLTNHILYIIVIVVSCICICSFVLLFFCLFELPCKMWLPLQCYKLNFKKSFVERHMVSSTLFTMTQNIEFKLRKQDRFLHPEGWICFTSFCLFRNRKILRRNIHRIDSLHCRI